ncbi:MAG: hypothetical protein CMN30_10225 [Sandaracinus sp.]|nr:hypothetical protein [Sandaracinus sp.]|tara:strand:- start:7 stop:894 length:888 start_codon:yes stop_codon:yes gene_type:complete
MESRRVVLEGRCMARETASKAIEFLFERMGPSADRVGWTRGLAAAEVDPRAFGSRVDWDDYATIVERAFPSAAAAESFGAETIGAHPWWTFFEMFGRSEPRRFVHRVLEVLSRRHRHWRWRTDLFGDPASLRVDASAGRCSAVVMNMVAGEIRGLGESVGAQIVGGTVRANGLVLELQFPVAAREASASSEELPPAARDALHLMTTWLEGDRPVSASVPSVIQLQEHHGMTRAEARIAHRLVTGRSVRQCADDLGVSASTVRTHLSRIFDKTGQRRQGALVAHLLRLRTPLGAEV